MALQIDYNEYRNCYLKASPTTVTDWKETPESTKVFLTYVIWYIYPDGNMETSMVSGGFEMQFDPNLPLYEQVYARMKDKFPAYENI